MKKLLSIAVTLSFLVTPLFATQTRIASLGVQNWMVEEDDNLLWMNPSRMADYQKQIWVEAVDNAGVAAAPVVTNWGGVTGKCPVVDGATVGLFVNRPYWGNVQNVIPTVGNELGGITVVPNSNTIPGWPAGFAGGQMIALAPATRFELAYVLPKMDVMTIGARLSSAGNTNLKTNKTASSPNPVAGVDGEAQDNRTVQDTNIAIGALFSNVGPFSVLDVVLGVDMLSAKDTAKLDAYTGAALGTLRLSEWETKFNPAASVSLTARAKTSLKGEPLLIYLALNNADNSNEFSRKSDVNADGDYTDAGDLDYLQKRTNTVGTTTLGAAYNSKLSKKTLLIVGSSLMNRVTVYDATTDSPVNNQAVLKENTTSKTTATQLGINMGVEHMVSKVVTGRIGMNQLLMQSTDVSGTQKTYAATAGSTTAFDETGKIDSTNITEAIGATAVTYGVGLKVLDNLTIDALVAQEIQFTGAWLTSGVVSKYVAQLTTTYKF